MQALPRTSTTGIRHQSEFGHRCRPLFNLAEGFVHLNYGSWGATPRQVTEKAASLRARMEERPDLWFRKLLAPETLRVREVLARYVDADVADLALTENVSASITAVLRSFDGRLGPGKGRVLCFSTVYEMIRNTLTVMEHERGRFVDTIPVSRVVQDDDAFLSPLREYLESGKGTEVRLAIVSHVSSTPALHLPVREIVHLLHKYDIKVLLDGAHAVGLVDLSIRSLGVEFYVAACHKWLFAPKGSALLWVSPEAQDRVFPAVVPSMIDPSTTRFCDRFTYTGSADYSSRLAIAEGIAFRQSLGDAAMREYTCDLAREAARMMVEKWGTEEMRNASQESLPLFNVRLPEGAPSDVNWRILEQHDIFFVVFEYHGQYWARFSAQIFLELEDFLRCADLVLGLSQ